jgi:hypothetical protein
MAVVPLFEHSINSRKEQKVLSIADSLTVNKLSTVLTYVDAFAGIVCDAPPKVHGTLMHMVAMP